MVNRTVKIKRKTGAMTVDAVLWTGIRDLILEARRTVVRGVNAALVWTNFEIGRRIVEYEQSGRRRAVYSEETLRTLSRRLTAEFGKGYSVTNLQEMREFYLTYGKQQTLSVKSQNEKSATASRISEKQISQTLSAKSTVDPKSETLSRISPDVFPLSWSHYVFLGLSPGSGFISSII